MPCLGMAIDFTSWATYLQGAVAVFLSWVAKTLIDLKTDHAEIRTIIKYYVERQTVDAAMRLDIPNPAPPDIRVLLQKHIQGEVLITDERVLLTTWLQSMGRNPDADAAERSAALQLLTGIKTLPKLKEKKHWWPF